MMLGMVIFWGLVILVIVFIARNGDSRGTHTETPHTETPTEILDRRLAEGAISAEEYQERRKLLISQR